MLLPKPKYNIINAMLQKENLDTMEVGELVGEIRAHEMGILGMSEEPTSSKSIALKTKANKSRKLKMIKQESSSSNEEDDHHESSSDVEDDGELTLMMRKFTRLNDKINKKGFNLSYMCLAHAAVSLPSLSRPFSSRLEPPPRPNS
jgi:hypothetical protein